MTPEQQRPLTKANRSLDAAKTLKQEGFYEFAVGWLEDGSKREKNYVGLIRLR